MRHWGLVLALDLILRARLWLGVAGLMEKTNIQEQVPGLTAFVIRFGDIFFERPPPKKCLGQNLLK